MLSGFEPLSLAALVVMPEYMRRRWEAERERPEIAELEELARLLMTLPISAVQSPPSPDAPQ